MVVLHYISESTANDMLQSLTFCAANPLNLLRRSWSLIIMKGRPYSSKAKEGAAEDILD